MIRERPDLVSKPGLATVWLQAPVVSIATRLLFAVCLVGGVAAVAPAEDSTKPLDAQAMQDLVAQALKSWDVPGVAVVVVQRDKVLWLHGHGLNSIESQQPLSHQTIFPIASCTKAFTATLIAMLADDGKLNWDDAVRKHWPEFRLGDDWITQATTLRDTMCHRTGLAQHDYLWYRAPWTPEDGVRRAGLLALERPFRTTFQYQSVLAAAAGFAAARAGGQSWEALIDSRIFQPLGMRTARTTTPQDGANCAVPHRAGPDGKLRAIGWYKQPRANPAGSICLSAQDLVGWLQFQLGDGTWGDKRLVSAKGLAETHMPQIPLRLEGVQRLVNPESQLMSYGLGWVIQDYRGYLAVSHAGAIDGFRAHVTLLPHEGLGFALLCNRHQTRMNLALNNILIDRLKGLPAKDWHAFYHDLVRQEDEMASAARAERLRHRTPDQPPSRPLDEYAGSYLHPAYGEIQITRRGQELDWKWSGFAGPMRQCGGEEFEIDDENLKENVVRFSPQGGRVPKLEFLNLPFVKR